MKPNAEASITVDDVMEENESNEDYEEPRNLRNYDFSRTESTRVNRVDQHSEDNLSPDAKRKTFFS